MNYRRISIGRAGKDLRRKNDVRSRTEAPPLVSYRANASPSFRDDRADVDCRLPPR
jgi:hypothetical protein